MESEEAHAKMSAAQAALPDMFEDFMEVVFKYQKNVPSAVIVGMLEIIKSHLAVFTSLH